MDYIISEKDVFYMRFGEQSSHAQCTGNTFIDSNLVTNGASSVNRSWNGTITETHTFSPTLVNTFLAAYGRSAPVFPPLFNSTGTPRFFLPTAPRTLENGPDCPKAAFRTPSNITDTISKVWGKHQLKFGAEVDRIQANSFFDNNVNGSLTFTSLSNFLQGIPFQYSQDFGNSVRGNRVWNEFFFVQDDWKITRTLTLNFGFREEIAGGVTEINGILSNVNPSLTNYPAGGAGTGPLGSFYTGGSYFHTNHNPGPAIRVCLEPGWRQDRHSRRLRHHLRFHFPQPHHQRPVPAPLHVYVHTSKHTVHRWEYHR